MADKPRKHAIALHPYSGTSSGGRYLSFSAGARIEVVRSARSAAAGGKLGGKLGWSRRRTAASSPRRRRRRASLAAGDETHARRRPKGASAAR